MKIIIRQGDEVKFTTSRGGWHKGTVVSIDPQFHGFEYEIQDAHGFHKRLEYQVQFWTRARGQRKV